VSISPRAICGALALAVMIPAAASAQPQQNPFAELFGRAPDRGGREFTAVQFRTLGGAQLVQTLETNFEEASALPEGPAAGGEASLDIDVVRTRIQGGIFSRYSYQEFLDEPSFGAPTFDGGVRMNIDATTRLSFQAGGRFAQSPYFRLQWLSPGIGGLQMLPADAAAIQLMQNQSVEGTAGVTSRYTRRSTLSAQVFTRETRFDNQPQHDFSARGFRGQWRRQMSRDLAVRAGYGREELFPRINGVRTPYVKELIDIGVDYAKSLEIARRTNFSFSTETTVLQENGGPRRLRLNGSINLERYFKRTWDAQLNVRRDTEFLPGFQAPVFTERARLSLNGNLATRLILNLSADGGQGEVAFYDSRKFISYSGGARLTLAMTRHLGVFTQYFYYQFQNPPEATPLSIAPRMARQAFSIGVQAWVPLLDREKVTSDTR
jgi:hypothetical protein